MICIKLPHTDFEVTEIAFGAWAIVGGFNWGHQDEKDSIDALRTAYEMGINFFDTAEMYGSGASENLIDKALKEVREKIIIATKIKPADFSFNDVKKATEERLKALNSDRLDLLQLHWPNPEIPIEETMGALVELKKEGKIRAFGVSNFGKNDLTEAFKYTDEISSNQLPYNLIWRAIEYEVLPECKHRHVPILCYSPIMQGLLTGKFTTPEEVPDDRARTRHFSSQRPQSRHGQEGCEKETFETLRQIKAIADQIGKPMVEVSIAWLMAQPAVGSVIVGGRNAEQVKKNIKAAELKLDDDVLAQLNKATEPLKQKLGKNVDLWEGESRIK
ncbi:myo-inositol catabolism protein IolS [Catalinimonas alkaloidigena]|uniref:aldo/keto reductase n=1 Tax=Catalinimonas alkaloidigena TaxID=1075417 RepID=UPI00240721FF|nr:aldo/keto reductase [Catalinimonas alkaloidigena]MDF9797511.1 myo-inositol catabolism protein IolS [Catalinimonas alkaloidigena]